MATLRAKLLKYILNFASPCVFSGIHFLQGIKCVNNCRCETLILKMITMLLQVSGERWTAAVRGRLVFSANISMTFTKVSFPKYHCCAVVTPSPPPWSGAHTMTQYCPSVTRRTTLCVASFSNYCSFCN